MSKPSLKEYLLGNALHGVLVAAGVLKPDAPITASELIAIAESYMKTKNLIIPNNEKS